MATMALAACSGSDGGGTAASTTAAATSTGSTGDTNTGSTTDASGDASTTTGAPTTGGPGGTGTATEGSSGTTSEATSTGGPPPVDPRQEALVQYAPRVWLHSAEEYFPSSVEFGFPSMTRFVGPDGNYWVRSTIDLDSPSDDSLAFFLGDLDDAPVYAYYADKGNDIVDLVYFFYYPYNRGKEVVDTIWGNHVGDWEHITVRLLQQAG